MSGYESSNTQWTIRNMPTQEKSRYVGGVCVYRRFIIHSSMRSHCCQMYTEFLYVNSWWYSKSLYNSLFMNVVQFNSFFVYFRCFIQDKWNCHFWYKVINKRGQNYNNKSGGIVLPNIVCIHSIISYDNTYILLSPTVLCSYHIFFIISIN